MMQVNETNHVGVDKSTLYGWDIVDNPGKLMMINKRDLHVDMDYQRNVSDSDAKIKRIAASWSWYACGVIIVANRNGKNYVIDGQHRVRASMKLSTVQELPCIVFDSMGVDEEAGAFLRSNRDRKPMKTSDAFKAMVISGDKDAIFVNNLVSRHGYVVLHGGTSQTHIQCIGQILQTAKRGHQFAERVFLASIAACSPDPIHSDIIKGLSYIDTFGPNDAMKNMSARLKDIGRHQLLSGVAKARAFHGGGGDKVCAEGILSVYNNRLRNKIELRVP